MKALWAESDRPRLLEELDEVSRQIRLLEAKRFDRVAELDRKGIAILAAIARLHGCWSMRFVWQPLWRTGWSPELGPSPKPQR